MEILRKMLIMDAGRQIYDALTMSTRRLDLHADENAYRSL